MIIVRSPHRCSILGGGTDVIPYVSRPQKYSLVLGFGLAQYNFLTLRNLPKFFPDYKTRLSYSQIEFVQDNSLIQHKVIKAALEYFDLDDGLEMSFLSDVPSKSGLGSSSSFLVSLIHALARLKNCHPTPLDLYKWAVDIEQNKLKENVGLQDSAWASLSGIGYIRFKEISDVQYTPIHMTNEEIRNFERHILLFYTNIPRVSSNVAKYYPSLALKDYEMDRMLDLTHAGIDLLKEKKYLQLGALMEQSWALKRSFDQNISSSFIDNVHDIITENSGFCKVTGAGGGGCILAFVPPEKQSSVRTELKDLTEIKVKIDMLGSHVIYEDNNETL